MEFFDLHGDEQLYTPVLGLVVTGEGLEVSHAGSVSLVREARLRQRSELGRVVGLELNSLVDSVLVLRVALSLDGLEVCRLL